jgi:hypothetical protein
MYPARGRRMEEDPMASQHTTRWVSIVVIALILLCALAFQVWDAIDSDAIGFYREQPLLLLIAAGIGIGAGAAFMLIANVRARMSPQARHRVLLVILGLLASCLMLEACYGAYFTVTHIGVLRWLMQLGLPAETVLPPEHLRIFVIYPLLTDMGFLIAGLFTWFLFYRAIKRPVIVDKQQ